MYGNLGGGRSQNLAWAIGIVSILIASSAGATEPDLPSTTTAIEPRVAQMETATVQVTGVKLEPTASGLDIILETASDRPLQLDPTKFRSEGNSLIVDLPNTVLALPENQTFTADNPTADIATVQVVPEGQQVRVTVVGTDELPKTAVRLRVGEKVYGLNAAGEEAELEIVVTAEEQEGYRVPNASTATRTDTPIRDIPQSIQIVPQQVLQDRQARSITDGLENVSGVTSIFTTAGSRDYFTIRGFEYYGNAALVNGLPDPQITSDSSFVNVERLEVLKGPASVLYGETGFSAPGGIINFVTKQPLRDPFYEISATVGSFNDYQGAIDLTGPLNDSKTALYRFNAGYRSTESFVDFNEARKLSIAPSFSFSLGQNTDLTIEGDVNIQERNGQQPGGLPAVGSVLPNPNGKVSRSFNPIGPVTDNLTINGRFGYSLEHRFNESWKLRNAFRYVFYDDDDRGGTPDFSSIGLADDNRTLNREATIGSQFYDFYYLDWITITVALGLEHLLLQANLSPFKERFPGSFRLLDVHGYFFALSSLSNIFGHLDNHAGFSL
jgi:iron complex outermembrane recepter protein